MGRGRAGTRHSGKGQTVGRFVRSNFIKMQQESMACFNKGEALSDLHLRTLGAGWSMDSLSRETGGGAASREAIATVIKLRDDKERN